MAALRSPLMLLLAICGLSLLVSQGQALKCFECGNIIPCLTGVKKEVECQQNESCYSLYSSVVITTLWKKGCIEKCERNGTFYQVCCGEDLCNGGVTALGHVFPTIALPLLSLMTTVMMVMQG